MCQYRFILSETQLWQRQSAPLCDFLRNAPGPALTPSWLSLPRLRTAAKWHPVWSATDGSWLSGDRCISNRERIHPLDPLADCRRNSSPAVRAAAASVASASSQRASEPSRASVPVENPTTNSWSWTREGLDGLNSHDHLVTWPPEKKGPRQHSPHTETLALVPHSRTQL